MGSAARAPITERDLEVLRLLSEHRVAIVAQLAVALGVAPQTADTRMRKLAKLGLVGHQRIFEGRPAAVWITRRGLGAIESPLPAPRVDLKGYRHDLGVGWLWLAARDGAFGPISQLRADREMRSLDSREHRVGPPQGVGVGLFGPAGRPERHYPDLRFKTASGHGVAVELELTPKSARRLQRIMLAYAGDPSVETVLYLVPDASMARRIETAARRAGIGSRVHVQRLAPGGIHGAPEPGLLRRSASSRKPTRSGPAR